MCVFVCICVIFCVNMCQYVSFCVILCRFVCSPVCIVCICTYFRVPNCGCVFPPPKLMYRTASRMSYLLRCQFWGVQSWGVCVHVCIWGGVNMGGFSVHMCQW